MEVPVSRTHTMLARGSRTHGAMWQRAFGDGTGLIMGCLGQEPRTGEGLGDLGRKRGQRAG